MVFHCHGMHRKGKNKKIQAGINPELQLLAFKASPLTLLSRQVGSNLCHSLSRQVSCPLHQWYYTILLKGLRCESEVGWNKINPSYLSKHSIPIHEKKSHCTLYYDFSITV